MVKNIDLHQVLQRHQEVDVKLQQDKLLLEAYNILNGKQEVITRSKDYLDYTEDTSSTELIVSEVLDPKRIFSIKEIRKVSIDYHLRFLDSKNYMAEIPYNVHLKCSAFELRAGVPVKFKILTEATNFRSKYPNSQHLIFADLGNNEFYFITKWGNPFTNIRKITAYPFKSLETVMVSVLLFALLIAVVTPSSFILTHGKVDVYFSLVRAAFYFYCVIFLSAIFTYYIVALRKNLNVTEWDSDYFV